MMSVMMIVTVLQGMVNVEEEISKLEKKKEKTEGDRAKLLKTTQAAAYSKVPEAKKAENTAKVREVV